MSFIVMETLANVVFTGVAVVFFAIFYLLGRALLKRVTDSPLPVGDETLFSLGLGLGAISLTLFLLGLAGLWKPTVLALLPVAAALLGVAGNPDLVRWSPIRGLRSTIRAWPRRDKILLGVLGLSFLLYVPTVLSPEVFYDSLVYHLALPKLWLMEGKISPTPGMAYAGIPMNMEMVFALGLHWGGERLAKLLNFLTAGGATLGVFLLARRVGERWAALAAALLFATWYESAKTFLVTAVEIGSTFYVVSAMLALDRWSEDGRRRWMVLLGLFTGFAVGVKYTNALVAPTMAAFAWFGRPTGSRERRGAVVTALLAAALTAAPWLMKNTAFYGNPLHPFATDLFRSSAGPSRVEAMNADVGAVAWKTFPSRDFLRSAARSVVIGQATPAEAARRWALAVLLLAAAWRFGSSRERRLAGLFLTLWTLYGLLSTNQRFRLPALPPIFALAAFSLGNLVSHREREWTKYARVVLLIGVAALGQWRTLRFFHNRGGWRCVAGLQTRADYLTGSHWAYDTPVYASAHFINRMTPPEARILLLGDARAFHFDRRFIAGSIFDEPSPAEWIRAGADAEEIFRRLQSEAISHIVVNFAQMESNRAHYVPGYAALNTDTFATFWRRHLRLVYLDETLSPADTHHSAVFEVHPATNAVTPDEERQLALFRRILGQST
jgi:4-amino-4-deoxy-L-arabinose transferase-like glycosyltransferase